MSAKGRILGALGSLVLKDARVTSVERLAPRLRRVRLAGEALRGVAWTPGDKVQVLLPNRDVRTYTPCGWDADAGGTSLLVFVHGDGPGARWGGKVAVGDTVRFIGPQPSLRPPSGPATVFGDETAFGLVEALGGRGVLEVSDLDAGRAFTNLHPGTAVIPADGERHLDRIADTLVSAGGTLVLAGRARSIQGIRARLQARGIAAPTHVKAYWADGKVGLD